MIVQLSNSHEADGKCSSYYINFKRFHNNYKLGVSWYRTIMQHIQQVAPDASQLSILVRVKEINLTDEGNPVEIIQSVRLFSKSYLISSVMYRPLMVQTLVFIHVRVYYGTCICNMVSFLFLSNESTQLVISAYKATTAQELQVGFILCNMYKPFSNYKRLAFTSAFILETANFVFITIYSI